MTETSYGWMKAEKIEEGLVLATLIDDGYRKVDDAEKIRNLTEVICGPSGNDLNSIVIDFNDTNVIESEKIRVVCLTPYNIITKQADALTTQRSQLYLVDSSEKLAKLIRITKADQLPDFHVMKSVDEAIARYHSINQ
jgi:hypothetical protein